MRIYVEKTLGYSLGWTWASGELIKSTQTIDPLNVRWLSRATFPISLGGSSLESLYIANQTNGGATSSHKQWNITDSGSTQSYRLNFNDNTNTVMTLEGENNYVGIGTTTPISPLHINFAGDDSVLSLSRNVVSTTNTAVNGLVQFMNGTYSVAGVGSITAGATQAGSLVFRTGTISTGNRAIASNGVLERMRIASDGNVGIGDYSNTAINPTSYLSINTGPLGTSYSAGTNALHALMIGSPSTGGDYFVMGVDQRMDFAYMYAATRGVGGTKPIIMQADGGGVSIGTFSNTAKMHIWASSVATGFRLQDTTQGVNKALVSDATGHGSWLTYSNILAAVNGVTGSGVVNYVPYWRSVNNLSATSSIYLNGDNVGIGTLSAAARLHITSNTVSAIIASGSTTTDLVRITQTGTGNAFVVEDFTNPDTTQFVISTSGDVGIGTASPSAKLDVAGSINVLSGLNNTSLRPTVSAGTLTNGEIRAYGASGSNYDDGFLRISAGGGTNPGSGKTYIDITGYSTVDDMNNNVVIGTRGTERMRVDRFGNVGIGLTVPTAELHVRSNIANSTIIKTDGVAGEILTATDNLVGSLFSVNDISGIPVFEAFSDNTIVMGDYQAPSLYTTTKQVRAAGLVNSTIYQFSATTYTSAHIDYNVQSGLSTRAGTIVAIWNGTNLEYNETSTQDIGSGTGAITLNVSLSGTNVLLSATTAVGGGIWTIKAIIRAV